jgi:hypothetical protein
LDVLEVIMTTLATVGTWPSVTDNDGSDPTTGTTWDAAFDQLMQDAIDDQCHSTNNPTIKPKDTTDEVVTSRGSEASLTARLDVHCNAAGVLSVPATVSLSTDLGAAIGQDNLLVNETFLITPGGMTVAPSGWTLSGATIVITGDGEVDTRAKLGKYAAKLTRVAGSDNLKQQIVDSGVYGDFNDALDGLVMGFGCWVWCDTANLANIELDDGDSQSAATDFHTGGSTWEWLSGTHTIGADSTLLSFAMTMANLAGDAYFAAPTAIFSPVAPSGWKPTPKRYGEVHWVWRGAVPTGDNQRRAAFSRPALIKDFQAYASTTPGVGNTLTIDAEVYDGATWQSMFSAPLDILDGDVNAGSVQPDGTYAYRCLAPLLGATLDDNIMRLNIDTVDSTADLNIIMRVMQYDKVLEDFMAYDDVG